MRILAGVILTALIVSAQTKVGEFEGAADVGSAAVKGEALYDANVKQYGVTSGGANIWGRADELHMVWRKQTGDVVLTTKVAWATEGGDPHKKAGLMLRAGLGGGDAHASLMAHADGLIALQYRAENGGETKEVRTPVKGPARLRLARHGDVISAEVAREGGAWQPVAALTVKLGETVFAGLAACSHNASDRQTAVFSGVEYESTGVVDAKARVVESTLEIYDTRTGERRIVRRAKEHFEAPNWTPDGGTLIYNGGGKIWRIPVAGGEPAHVPAGEVRVNNDHGLSPGGQWLVISGSVGRGQSQIFILPVTGGEPKLITPKMPSYWHGWSPDGKTLAYCASRDGEYDVYTIPTEGGEETRLTDAKGLDDGPEYSPDGKWIYFNSDRTGLMKIWRMAADGSDEQQFTHGEETGDWFAHPSPDGKQIVYIAYDPTVKGHPANKDVTLRMTTPAGEPGKVIVTLFGGQGTINVPSWSPDSTRFAFVSYRLVGK